MSFLSPAYTVPYTSKIISRVKPESSVWKSRSKLTLQSRPVAKPTRDVTIQWIENRVKIPISRWIENQQFFFTGESIHPKLPSLTMKQQKRPLQMTLWVNDDETFDCMSTFLYQNQFRSESIHWIAILFWNREMNPESTIRHFWWIVTSLKPTIAQTIQCI